MRDHLEGHSALNGRRGQLLLPFPGIRGSLDAMDGWSPISDVRAEVGPRLKWIRTERDVTLTELASDRPFEILSILGREGERIHARVAPRRTSATG